MQNIVLILFAGVNADVRPVWKMTWTMV